MELKMTTQRKMIVSFGLIACLLFIPFHLFAGGEKEVPLMDTGKAYSGTTLSVLMLEQAYTAGIEELLPEFEELTGIKVEIEKMAQGAVIQKIGIELISKSDAYDVVFMMADSIPKFAGGGFLSSIDGFLDDETIRDSDVDLDDFIQSTLDAFRYEGKQYGLPFFAACQMMYYRFDILEKYGFTEPPKTFEELLAMARTIHTDEIPAIALRGQAGGHNIWVWSQFLYGMGGHFFKDFPNDMTPVIDSPEAVKALEIYAELMQDYSIPGAASSTYDEVVIAMQQGKVAIAIEGGPLGGRILDPEKTKVSGKIGFAVSPGGPAGVFPPFTAQALVMNAASNNKEAAFLFMQWSTSKEILKKISLNQLHLAVTRNSIWSDSDFIDKYDFNWGHGSFAQAYADTLAAGPFWYRPAFENWAEDQDRVGLALQEAVVNKKTPQQALTDANADLMKIMIDGGFIK